MEPEAKVTIRPHYVRDHKNRPVVTFMVAKVDAERFAVGIAYCSERDMPSKKVGKRIATKRLMGAINANKNGIGAIITYGNGPDGEVIVKNYLGTIDAISNLDINHSLGDDLLLRIASIFQVVQRKCSQPKNC